METPADIKTSGPTRKIPRRRTVLILLILSGLLLALLLAVIVKNRYIKAERAATMGQNTPAVNVVLYELQPRTIHDRLNLPGTVEPWIDLNVLAQVGDTIREKAVEDGDIVAEGDLLAVIDDRKYQNAYDSAAASLTSALASAKRIRSLRRRNLASQADLDNIEATVKNTRAARDNAALDLSRCRIRAPIAGVINKVFVEQGEVVSPGQPIARILQLNPVKITVGIPESDVSAVRRLEEFTVTIDALEGRTCIGRKHFLSQTTETHARLYDLTLVVDNPDHEILPDMFTRVDIVKQTIERAVVVPLYALTATDTGYTVYVAENGTARLRLVTPGIQEGFQVEITDGLDFGEKVIVVGQKRVADDQPVNIVRTVTDPDQVRL